jgi:hypothetical protein
LGWDNITNTAQVLTTGYRVFLVRQGRDYCFIALVGYPIRIGRLDSTNFLVDDRHGARHGGVRKETAVTASDFNGSINVEVFLLYNK